jgi:RND superfamily putative drug exporter
MRLAGDWNWWAPGPLRRIYDRWGISESVDLDDGVPPPGLPAGDDRDGGDGLVTVAVAEGSARDGRRTAAGTGAGTGPGRGTGGSLGTR